MAVTIRPLRLERPASRPLDQCPVVPCQIPLSTRPEPERGRPGSHRRHLPRQDSVLPSIALPEVAPERLELSCSLRTLRSERSASTTSATVLLLRWGSRSRVPRADPAGLKPAASRFVARCSVRLSYRSWGVGREPNPRPRETDRARTGIHPGHNRALCPVKLRSPCNAWVRRGAGALNAWGTKPSGPMRSRTSISGSSGRRLYRISYRTRSRATSGDGGDRTRIPAVQTPCSPVELHPHKESRAGIEPA